MKKIIVSTPGRACLFGEHMDWCGYYVLPAAVDMRSYMEATLGNRLGIVEVYSYKPFDTYAVYNLKKLEIDSKSDLRYVAAVIKAMLQRELIKGNESLRLRFLRAKEVSQITGNTDLRDLPVKKGLSSSAAISVATAAAVDLLLNSSYEEKELKELDEKKLVEYADLAYTGERKILGINCGQMDQYASSFGSILFIDCRSEPAKVEPLRPKVDMPLIIGDTRQPKDTPRILAWLGERFRKREPLFMEGLRGIVEVVLEAKKELSKSTPNLYKIGELMNLNQHYLAKYLKVSGDCPISPSKLDKLIQAALDAGALGAKLSGSGGGGCMIALCLPQDIEKVAKAIQKAGGDTYTTKVAPKGVKIEHVEY